MIPSPARAAPRQSRRLPPPSGTPPHAHPAAWCLLLPGPWPLALGQISSPGEFLVIPALVAAGITLLWGALRIRALQRRLAALDAVEKAPLPEGDLSADELLNAALKASPHAVFCLDRNARVTLWNEAAERTFGWSAAELLGQELPFIPEDERPAAMRNFTHVMSGLGMRDLVIDRQRRDGVPIKLSYSAEPVRDAQGTVHGVMIVADDITQTHQTSQELEANHRLLRQMGKVAKVGGWELVVATMKPRWTEETLHFHDVPLGAEPDVARALDFYPPEARPLIENAMTRAIQEGEPWDLITPFIRGNGEEICVRTIGLPVVEEGKVVSILGTFQDITSQRHLDQQLIESRERLALATEAAQVGIWEVDIHTRMVDLDATAARLYGLEPVDTQLTTEAWQAMVHEEDAERLTRMILASTQMQGTIRGTCRVPLPDGALRHLQVVVEARRNDEGTFLRLVGATWDISDRVERELALKAAKDAAEHGDRAKSDFLAMMSHEIRTPLNAIIGFADLLKYSSLSPEQKTWLQHVESSGAALLSLVEDILDYSKIETGQMDLQNLPFDPRTLLDEACAAPQLAAREQGLQFVYSCGDSVPDILEGDAERIRQILANLVDNAVKFTEQGSVRVWMEARYVDLAEPPETPGEMATFNYVLTIRVVDTGIGIAESLQPQLFTPFTQGDSGLTRRFGGTGLGLAICRRLAELMRGTVEVESREGQGSAFTCQLVVSGPPPQTSPGTPQECELEASAAYCAQRAEERLGHLPVLVAEDHPLNQRLIHAYLRHLGFRDIDLAKDGVEAVEMFEKRAYALILLDLQMPRTDGLEAMHQMRRRQAERQAGDHDSPPVGIFALTANASQENRERCLVQGMDGFLTKPLVLRQLEGMMEAWLQDHPELLRRPMKKELPPPEPGPSAASD